MGGAILLFLLCALPAAAQRPGEIAGRVVEAGTAAPVEAAAVEVPALGVRAWTDGAGRFRFRGVEPGSYRIRVSRAGYAARLAEAEVRNGEEAWIDVQLAPAAVALQAVRVTAEAEPAGGTRVSREQIEAGGARTAAEVLERVPGVLVRSTSATGAQTVSIRGSTADAVLVLVDGVPLNDPVTGEADLSGVSAQSIDRVTVLPGGRSARYGPRAAAGVVLIETRAAEVRRMAELSAGTLEERAGRAEWGAPVADWVMQAGGEARRIEGGFDHPRSVDDPTIVHRRNADLAEWSAFAALAGRAAGGELRARGGWDALRRGLPGQDHTPSELARQEMERGRGSLSWRRSTERGGVSALLSGASQRVRFSDPDPPIGTEYDDTTRVRTASLRVEMERVPASGAGDSPARYSLFPIPYSLFRGWGGGLEASTQRVDAGALSASAPRARTDVGAFAHASAGFGRGITLAAEGRIDRDGVTEDVYLSRSLTAGAALGIVRIHLANRSSYSPPSLGDQFFRAGVGVQPNPDLRPERVPNEWELGASASTVVGGAEVSAHAAAFAGDVRGMILWLPDFAFRWSPRNVDALRRGIDTRAEVLLPRAGVRLTGAYSLARVTYDEPGVRGIQLPYRPRHTGSAGVEWRGGGWRVDAFARYTGVRHPAAARVNALPGFWSTALRAGRDWRVGGWTMTAAVDVDRALDERDSLIAGYPEPGRRVRLDVRVARTGYSSHQER
ncbi:MAG TPA: TonB-dependent receptor [Longimicrobium sp.]|uniref:TonB-dependent receptor n=1 Tax=Longimicrobium sp. TaxID=2029185 RepID=UPI002ED8F9FA